MDRVEVLVQTRYVGSLSENQVQLGGRIADQVWQSFRGDGRHPTSGDGAFDNFQAGLPLEDGSSMLQPNSSHGVGLRPGIAAGLSQVPYPTAMHHGYSAADDPHRPASLLDRQALQGGQSRASGAHDWVNQFDRLGLAGQPRDQLSGFASSTTGTSVNQQVSRHWPNQNHDFLSVGQPLIPQPASMYDHLRNGARGFYPSSPGPALVALPSEASNSSMNTVPSFVTNVATDEAFDEAFREYDDSDFQTELDDWMAENGPHREALRFGTALPSTLDANLDQLAKETDARREAGEPELQPQRAPAQEQQPSRQEQDELARAALNIVNSVSSETSDKFLKSSFIELMRRIRDRQVVVAGDNLVDAATGETISTASTGKSNEDPNAAKTSMEVDFKED
jgi:hypothetical protein